jgi:hypothetical protein
MAYWKLQQCKKKQQVGNQAQQDDNEDAKNEKKK